jgi:hypothetical protein
VKVLEAVWDEYGKPCGKLLLVPMIRGMIDFLEGSEKPAYGITEEIRELFLTVSPAEADILRGQSAPRREIKFRGGHTSTGTR